MRRAIRAAARFFRYPPGNFDIVFLENHIFQLEIMRRKEIRKICIVLDKIKPDDEKKVENYQVPDNYTKEIWCRKINGQFEIKIIP